MLPVEDPGDDRVGVVHGEPPDQVDGVLIGADLRAARRRSGTVSSLIAPPFHRSTRSACGAGSSRRSGDVHFVQQGAQQLLAVLVGGGGRVPYLAEVVAEGQDRGPLGRGQGLRAGRPGGGPARLRRRRARGARAPTRLPGRGRPAGCRGRRRGSGARPGRRGSGPARPGGGAGPAPRRGRASSCSAACRQALQRRRLQSGQERAGDGGVDGLPADAHVPGAAAVDQLSRALAVVVRHASGRAGVEDRELAAAGAAGGQALQQRAAFPDRAGARLAACGRMLVPMRAWLAW